jgi:hypothetical protein
VEQNIRIVVGNFKVVTNSDATKKMFLKNIDIK